MSVVGLLLQLATCFVLTVAFALSLFIATTSIGRPVGPSESVVLWAMTACLGWVAFRRWERVRTP
jgi:hypothetical protein